MRAFTDEEFKIMVDELVYNEHTSYEMLCRIAEKTLKPSVIKWCSADSNLYNSNKYEDVLQEIYVRLIQKVRNDFLLKDGDDGPLNYDPDGFSSWMFTVAKNRKIDCAIEEGKRGNHITPTDPNTFEWTEESEESGINQTAGASQSPFEKIEREEKQKETEKRLKNAVNTVLENKSGIYITLTWLALNVLMYAYDINKIKATGMLVKHFEHRRLNDMYALIKEASSRIPWLKLTKEQCEEIESALNRRWDDKTTYGETEYSTFFMKAGGKKSVSDWANRMKNKLWRSENGTS